ncbi:nitronate monooxygenase (plasmid) [Skermanella mucosa]|uniref:NAD(P)H-dependent flavin oxidoreductase n=1 Tax=Skermanella mucosa TaxID=1789672 RepID=UPI001E3B59D1|nr:nitronate monooxygenase [Skermanella mucosa]UEM25215.1 nitronate monooxygenase [Skermanella mucosa]
MLNTRVTEFFGTRIPIVASGLQWLATADYAAAASRAGIMGFITAASFPEPAALRDEIRRCRDLAEGGPFGVNVSMLPKLVEGDRTEAVFDLIAEEGVRFVETSGRNPEPYLPRLRAAGIKVVHKVPTVKHARKAQSVGVDMVEVIGAEAGGHPGMELIGTMVQSVLAAREITVPLVIGGGIGTGEQLVAALALGADGVLMGTRFLVAEEVRAHAAYKDRLVEARETDTTLVMQSLRNTLRALRNETTDRIQQVEKERPGDLAALLPLVSGKLGRQAYETGDMSLGALSLGQSVIFADRVEPLAAIVARIEAEAERALERLRGLM